jgi:site-specific recombinase XerC
VAPSWIVPEGTQRGERMHKARHSAGQRLLDATGNLRAVQQTARARIDPDHVSTVSRAVL